MTIQAGERRKTKWQQKREASYLALVEAAMRRFHEHGYAATRVEDIVEGTGYTAGAFYFHFKGKADCFWHVIEHRQKLRGDWSKIADGLDPETTPLAAVLAKLFVDFTEKLDGLNNWFLVMVDFSHQHDDAETKRRLREVYARWHAELESFVTSLQDGGWIALDRDPHLLTTQLFAVSEGLNAHAALYGIDPTHAEQALIDALIRILEDGRTTSKTSGLKPRPRRGPGQKSGARDLRMFGP